MSRRTIPIPAREILVLALLLSACGSVLRAGQHPLRAEVVALEDLNHDTRRVRFRVLEPSHFTFTPGQFVFLKLPDDFVREWNARHGTRHGQVARPYSFASSSSDLPLFDLIVRLVPAPPGKDVPSGIASTYIHKHLKVGDAVSFSAPSGKLYLGEDSERPAIIVAGGTGAAPFISLLEHWFEKGIARRRRIHFFFGVRSRRDLFLDELFRKWACTRENFTYIPAVAEPLDAAAISAETGLVSAVLDRHIEAPSDADAYLAGPPAMLREVVKVLGAKGITKERIHYDAITVR